MLGTTAFVFTEDRRLKRERIIDYSLTTEEKGFSLRKPTSIFAYLYQFFISRLFLTCLSIYIIWTLIGIIFYVSYDNWSAATAFFYAMEAGLSIGYCNPTEKDDWSRLFTTIYILSGSIVVSGSVGLFASGLMFNRSKIVWKLKKGSSRKRSSEAIPAPYSPNIESKRRFKLDESIYYDDIDTSTWVGSLKYLWYNWKYHIGWYSNRFRVIITLFFIIWMVFGTLYGIYVENWTFITSLYFAITTVSTGGLQSPECINGTSGPTCDFGDMRGSVMGIFMFVGVPIYVLAFGQFARMVIQETINYREKQLLNRPIIDEEFIFAANVLSPEGSETLVLGEYILLELMRLGSTNQKQIETMKKRFKQLDVLKIGELDIDDLKKSGQVVPTKKEVMLDI